MKTNDQPSLWLRTMGRWHGRCVHRRRVEILASAIGELLEPDWQVVDVGCGDGTLAHRLGERHPQLRVTGLEIAPRPHSAIPVAWFDGTRLPLADRSCDAVLMVDVLHHTTDPTCLLREAARVARHAVIIKDHRTSRPGAKWTLRLMDWVGNRPHGVVLPYNYWSMRQWRQAWDQVGMELQQLETRLPLYPWPADWLFGWGLHWLGKLQPRAAAERTAPPRTWRPAA